MPMPDLAFDDWEADVRVIATSRQGRCRYERYAHSVISVDFTQSIEAPPAGFGFLDDLVNEVEADPTLQAGLAEARRMLAAERRDAAPTLAGLRLEQGFSQMQLAERLGTSQAAVSQLEGGQRQPGLPLLRKLAQALRVDLNTLDQVFPQ